MARLFVWLCGSVGLVYLAWRFAVWNLVWQMSIVAGLFLWVIIGGFLLAYKPRVPAPPIHVAGPVEMARKAAAARAAYVMQFGEASAAHAEQQEPDFWQRVAAYREGAK